MEKTNNGKKQDEAPMNITEIANRIANLHYPDIPKTRGDTMFRRQRVLELKKLVESELKKCSIPDVVATEGKCCDSFKVRSNYRQDQTCENCGQYPWDHKQH